jgi:hypothetical protein
MRSARSHDFRWRSAPASWTSRADQSRQTSRLPGFSVSRPSRLPGFPVSRLLGRQAPETPGFLVCENPMPSFRRPQMPWNAYGSSGDRFDGRLNRRAARRKAVACYCRFNTAMYTRIPAVEPRSSQLLTGSVIPKRVKLGHAMTGAREKTSRSRNGDGWPVVGRASAAGAAWWGRANVAGAASWGGSTLRVARGRTA